ncbi:MAG: FAD-dependent oxidoreductase [Sphingomonas sp.]|uniref:FAD-dependent oxidoreductase n=1 Tax=Sphingomonas sp. TaxID=28214 RepID=UPI0025EA8A45|nr:FAD-dependent oxidoreductase [Sphingomonas sp.]MBX3566340.1 FAD-dependent oxidoreductase [Sphingomonas sp.]
MQHAQHNNTPAPFSFPGGLDDLKAQVLVVGAGAAGVSAAISAARTGADTVLIEGAGFLGGISATLPWLGFHDREYRQVVKGFAAECVDRLAASGHASGYVFDPKCGSLASLDSHMWKCLAMELAQAAGVRVLLHTQCVDTIREGDRIAGVIVHHKSGFQRILADVTVDTSGDGDVAARGGVDWEKGRTADGLVQAPTLVFRLGGLNRTAFVAACKDPANIYREWFRENPALFDKFTSHLDSISTFVLGGFAALIERARAAGDFLSPQTRIVGVKTHADDEISVVMTRVLGLDPTDVQSMSNAYAKVYEQIPPLVAFFQKYVPGCEQSRLVEIAPMLGVRESRRIMGDHVLTMEEMVEGVRHPDGVAMGGYHIDIHRPKGTWVESHNVQAYTIPLRSLIARDVDGLMMAGKCISATHEAIAGTRVIPICMAEGEAVGVTAAFAALHGSDVRSVSVSAVQDRLIATGAELGQSLGGPNHAAIESFGQLPMEEPPTEGDCDPVSASETAWV